jgi:solute carrier family 50 protein (sugar transporter)
MLFVYHMIKGDFATVGPAIFLALGIITYVSFEILTSDIVGLLATGFNFYLVASTLPTLTPAFVEKNPVYINMTIILASLANSVCWLLYGILTVDFYVWSPNLSGVLLGVF